jgi:hypothetical protein
MYHVGTRVPFLKGYGMKIADKLSKVDETVNVHMYDNGFLVEVSGRDHGDDWANVKILCTSLAEVSELIEEATKVERS